MRPLQRKVSNRTEGPPGTWSMPTVPGAAALIRHSRAVPEKETSCWVKLSSTPAAQADLPLDDVHAGEHLGDGVLHLEPDVHLHKVVAAVAVQEKLQGTGVDIAHPADRPGSPRSISALALGG